jgi:hypothetical protein
MDSRQRWIRFFEGKSTDRVPIWLLFPFHPVDYYVDVYRNPSYEEILASVAKHNIDILNRRNFHTGFCFNASPDIRNYKRERLEGGKTLVDEVIECGDQTFVRTFRPDVGVQLKGYVDSVEDFDRILSLPYEPPRPNLTWFFEEERELGTKGLMMVDAGDATAVLYHLCTPEQYSLWSLTERKALCQFLDALHERVADFYRYLLDAGVGPVFFAVGAEFAGPPLVSPTNFWDFAGKYLAHLVELVHSKGCKFILHYHGKIRKVLPYIKQIAPDAVHTIEAPPVGDCTIWEAREILGEQIALVGNVQYDDLLRRSPEEIRTMVKNIIAEDDIGRLVVSPTAGPYEETISPRVIENYLEFIKAGVEFGTREGGAK